MKSSSFNPPIGIVMPFSPRVTPKDLDETHLITWISSSRSAQSEFFFAPAKVRRITTEEEELFQYNERFFAAEDAGFDCE